MKLPRRRTNTNIRANLSVLDFTIAGNRSNTHIPRLLFYANQCFLHILAIFKGQSSNLEKKSKMFLVAITGGIATGKSSVAKMFVFDSSHSINSLQRMKKSVDKMKITLRLCFFLDSKTMEFQ